MKICIFLSKKCKQLGKWFGNNMWALIIIGIIFFIFIPFVNQYLIKNNTFDTFTAFMVFTVLFSLAADILKSFLSILYHLIHKLNKTLKYHYYKKEVNWRDLVIFLGISLLIVWVLTKIGYVDKVAKGLSIDFINLFKMPIPALLGVLFGYFACYKLARLGLNSAFAKDMEKSVDKYKIIFAFIYYNYLLSNQKGDKNTYTTARNLFLILFNETSLIKDNKFNEIFPQQVERINQEKLSDELGELEYIMDIIEQIHSNNLNEQNLRTILQIKETKDTSSKK